MTRGPYRGAIKYHTGIFDILLIQKEKKMHTCAIDVIEISKVLFGCDLNAKLGIHKWIKCICYTLKATALCLNAHS